VRGDVLLIVRWLGVPFESFREALGDSGGRADVLRFGQQSGCPDAISVFQLFVREFVGLVVGPKVRFVRSESRLIIVRVLYESGERSSPAGINPADVLLLRVAFFLKLGATAGAESG